MRSQLLICAFAIGCGVIQAAEEPAKVITPEEAAKRVNEQVTVQMEVKSSSLRGQVCFLNSEKDFKDAKNFTVFIGREALQKMKEAKIDDPATHFQGKQVRVKGKVTLYRDKPQIVVDAPDQIMLVVKPDKSE